MHRPQATESGAVDAAKSSAESPEKRMNDQTITSPIAGDASQSARFAHLASLITAVLPTYNRPQYLERASFFYRNAPFRVIVVDSSDAPYEGMLPRNFVYHYQPAWPYCQKVAFAVGDIETPYSMLISDDDFFFYSALDHEIAFLEANPSYGSAQGFYMTKPPDEISKVIAALYAHRPAFRIDADDPGGRLLQLKANYMHLMYSVHRTRNLQPILERGRYLISGFAFEFLLSFAAVAMGKHVLLPYLHCVRESIANSSGRDPHGFYGLRLLPSRMREVSYGFYALQTILRDVMGFDTDSAYAMVDRITPDSIEPRTVEERTPPPLGPHPKGVPEPTLAEWSRMWACASNAKLLDLDLKLRNFIAEVEEHRKLSGGRLPETCSQLSIL